MMGNFFVDKMEKETVEVKVWKFIDKQTVQMKGFMNAIY